MYSRTVYKFRGGDDGNGKDKALIKLVSAAAAAPAKTKGVHRTDANYAWGHLCFWKFIFPAVLFIRIGKTMFSFSTNRLYSRHLIVLKTKRQRRNDEDRKKKKTKWASVHSLERFGKTEPTEKNESDEKTH